MNNSKKPYIPLRTYERPELLVETDWLADNLDSPDLRIFDCAAQPSPNPDEGLRTKFPIRPMNCRDQYEQAHIPGAGYIDVPGDLTDKSSDIPMMMAPVEQVIEVFSKSGIGNSTRVVLYSSQNPMWATRVWWTLRAVGFGSATILNGGWKKWTDENRPVSSNPCSYEPETLTANPKAGVFVDKQLVRSVLEKPDALLVHALTPSVYDGSNDALIFGRRGRIPGSVNVPSGTLHDTESGTYLHAGQLLELFHKAGADRTKKVITYCGGGINATNVAFALHLLGYDDVAIYDGSMNEWGNDVSLPIVLGDPEIG